MNNLSDLITDVTLLRSLAVLGVKGGAKLFGGAATSRGLSYEADALFEAGKNRAGGVVWYSTGKVFAEDVEALARQAHGAGSNRITILTGAHGSSEGVLTAERVFFETDVALRQSISNLKVIDVTKLSQWQLELVLNREGTVIFGVCNGSANSAVIKALAH